jgi:hypothetical protein
MLIKDETIEGIRSGKISLLFRRWSRPRAKAGGTQMTQGGVVAIDSMEIIRQAEITDEDAAKAGYSSSAKLIEHLNYRDDPLYRISVRFQGEDPRIALRSNADLSDDEMAELIGKLNKLDKNSRSGVWTRTFLQLIHDHPATYSGVLAKKAGMEIANFKPMVRKLKALGLTESLEVGYRLSARGMRVLETLG